MNSLLRPVGRFTSEFCAVYHSERDTWQLAADFWFQRPNGDQIMVPACFESDLASIPFKGLPGFPKSSEYNQASVVHDFLYSAEILPRRICDEIFCECLWATDNMPWWKIPIMYYAVRVGGGFTYKSHTHESIMKNRRLAHITRTERPLWKDGIARFI